MTLSPLAPRTMTLNGLAFLTALSAQHRSGIYLEIGPLFGSSTNAIDAGRHDPNTPIHTIDTFAAAEWVKKRFGQDLSRSAFDQYTAQIPNLHVHQGFAPDIVRDVWEDPIGFYFDDATHGDPGWTNNFEFFRPFFTDDAIICGDDFAGGWPDIIRNVQRLAAEANATLFVIGRVWAFTRMNESRLATAVHQAFPKLRQYEIETDYRGHVHRGLAANWSWGLHRKVALDSARLIGPNANDFGLTVTRDDGQTCEICLGDENSSFERARKIHVELPSPFSVQFCLLGGSGKSENSKDLRHGSTLHLTQDQKITSLRLSHS